MDLPRGSETVLLVDDDPNILETSGMMLSALGYTVLKAISGQEALKLWQESDQVDIVLTDLTMPDMDGREVLARLREEGYGGPVALLSGYSLPVEERRGFVGVLTKPFRLADLAGTIRSFLEEESG
ncbi:MAG TPA: response regulator [Bacteroidetes bacterium]|nr:response regulator [Bacteroidota bacterium]